MGQYHIAVNLDAREFIHPHKLGDGLKAWEQAANGPGGVGTALIYLMVAPIYRGGGDFKDTNKIMGAWHGDRVVIVGDYAESGDFDTGIPNLSASHLYMACTDPYPSYEGFGFVDVSEQVRRAMTEEFGWEYEGDGWVTRKWGHSA